MDDVSTKTTKLVKGVQPAGELGGEGDNTFTIDGNLGGKLQGFSLVSNSKTNIYIYLKDCISLHEFV